MELSKGKMNLQITKLNGKIQDAAIANDTPPANPIGFVWREPEEKYEDEEEED